MSSQTLFKNQASGQCGLHVQFRTWFREYNPHSLSWGTPLFTSLYLSLPCSIKPSLVPSHRELLCLSQACHSFLIPHFNQWFPEFLPIFSNQLTPNYPDLKIALRSCFWPPVAEFLFCSLCAFLYSLFSPITLIDLVIGPLLFSSRLSSLSLQYVLPLAYRYDHLSPYWEDRWKEQKETRKSGFIQRNWENPEMSEFSF